MTNVAEAAVTPKAAVAARHVEQRRTVSRSALRAISILSPILVLMAWEAFSRAGILDDRFFPAPTLIFQALWAEASSGELWAQTQHSLTRLVVGFLVGAIPAVVIGVAMGLNKVVDAAVHPLISALYPVPKSAVLPLFLLFFGLGEDTIWYFVAMGVFFPVVINTYTGVSNVSAIFYDVAENFGAKRLTVFRTVALPGAMPNVITGLELGAGMGLIMLAIAEMMGGQGNGWGFMVWNSFQLFTIESMYAYLLVFALVGLLLALIVGFVGHKLTPWINRH